jgi:hypothetical protein
MSQNPENEALKKDIEQLRNDLAALAKSDKNAGEN